MEGALQRVARITKSDTVEMSRDEAAEEDAIAFRKVLEDVQERIAQQPARRQAMLRARLEML